MFDLGNRAACALLAAAALAACGSDDGREKATQPSALATPRPETPTRSAGDKAIAENALVTLDDFPPGWARSDSGRDTRRCWARKISEAVSSIKGARLRTVKNTRLAVRARADQRAAARIAVALTVNGGDVDLSVDLVFVRAGRGVSLGAFVDAPIPFDEALRDEPTADQVRRLSDGLTRGDPGRT